MKGFKFWFFGGVIGLIFSGNEQIMAFMNEHLASIGWLAVTAGALLCLVAWLAFENDRIIEEERSEST